MRQDGRITECQACDTIGIEFSQRIDRFVNECSSIRQMLFTPAIDELQCKLQESRQQQEDEENE
jgi:hypothetical protein